MASKKQSFGTSLGGFMVGLDHLIFKTGKPAAEQVESARPVGPVAADGGGTLSISLPEDGPPASPGDGGGQRGSASARGTTSGPE